MPSDFHLQRKPLGGNIKIKVEIYKGEETRNNSDMYGLVLSEENDLNGVNKNKLLQKTELEISMHTPFFIQFPCKGKVYFLSLYNNFILGSPIEKE